jgi:hypothetical protein
MTVPRTRAVVGALVCLLASFATAALAHGAIAALGSLGVGEDADAYGAHGHGAVAPVALAAAALLAYALLRVVASGIARREHRDPMVALARAARGLDPRLPSFAVGACALGTLVGMEFVEQLAAFGHVTSVADALGGNGVAGVAIVAMLAVLVTILGLRFAHVLAAAALAVSRIVATLVVALRLHGDAVSRARIRLAHTGVAAVAGALLARCFGLRAPPARTRLSLSSILH